MTVQPPCKKSTISKTTRTIAIDWMTKIAKELFISDEMFFCAIGYMDAYTEVKNVEKKDYQAVALCSLFIANKLDNANHESISRYLEAMDNQISRERFLELEERILFALKFKLRTPTIYSYLSVMLDMLKAFKSVSKSLFLFEGQNISLKHKKLVETMRLVVVDAPKN